jgi:large subunit ribosomal protein L30
MKTYKITLVKSLNGRFKKHIATAESLGLKRIGDTTVQPDNAMTLGKIQQISYLIRVEEMN